ncbi:hypothetical protein V2J09_015794 [Rumex salicifolius]
MIDMKAYQVELESLADKQEKENEQLQREKFKELLLETTWGKTEIQSLGQQMNEELMLECIPNFRRR